jgi:hypothetical protein
MESLISQNTHTNQEFSTNSLDKRMRNYITFLCLVLFFAFISCKKDIDRICCPPPSFSIYKTKADYFYNVDTWEKKVIPFYHSFNIHNFILANDTTVTFRIRLADGYVLDYIASENGYFTDITFCEFYSFCEQHNSDPMPFDSILERVVEKNPYLEFYIVESDEWDSLRYQDQKEQINEIIRNCELEKYFERLK